MFKMLGLVLAATAFWHPGVAQSGSKPARLAILSTQCYGADNDVRFERNVVRTPDGGVLLKMLYVVGSTGNIKLSCIPPSSGGSSYGENLFIKLDSNGVQQWDRCYPYKDSSVNYILPQTDAGEIQVGFATLSGGVRKEFVRRTRPNGTVAWTRYYQVSEAFDLAPAADGGYYLTGTANTAFGDIPSHYGSTQWDDIWLMKLDSSGNKQWLKVIGGSLDDASSRVLPQPDGGVLLLGTTNSSDYDCTGQHNPNTGTGDAYACRLDKSGNILWHRCYGGTSGETVADAIGDEKGGAWIAVNASSKDGDVTGQVGTSSIWLFHIDSAGTLLSGRSYVSASDSYVYGATLCRDKSGAMWIAGNTGAKSGGDVDTNYGGSDAWVLRLDSAGKLTGTRVLGTQSNDASTTIIPLAGDRMLVGGYFIGPDTNPTMPQEYYGGGSPNAFLTRLGNWPMNVREETAALAGRLVLYPNPPADELHVQLEGIRAGGQLEVVDGAGRRVYGPVPVKQAIDLHTNGWAAGSYHVRFTGKDGRRLTQSLLIP